MEKKNLSEEALKSSTPVITPTQGDVSPLSILFLCATVD